MPNTAENDSPYVIGAIEDAGTADYESYQIGNSPSGFDGDTINPVVVNADGSFVTAFPVTAPSYFWNLSASASSFGSAFIGTAGGVVSEIVLPSVVAASPGSITYTLAGRSSSNALVQIPVTVTGNTIVLTEAILANFAPGSSPTLILGGLQPSSSVSAFVTVDVANFYDGFAPDLIISAFPSAATVPSNGAVNFSYPTGMVESFGLTNAAAWTTPSTVYRIAIVTQEPLDLSGVSGTIDQSNVFVGTAYRTLITVARDGDALLVPQTVLQQLESQPASVTLQVTGAVPGAAPQAQMNVQFPVTTITEGLYVQHFDADGLPTGDAVRVDQAADALLQDQDYENFLMSRSAEGGMVIAWAGNADTDSVTDAIYVRKLDDAGVPTSDTVAITGLSEQAIASLLEGDGSGVLTGLADGGFAMAYTVQADEIGQTWTGSVFPGGLSISGVGGQLQRVELTQFTAPGAISAALYGNAANGSPVSVPVTLVNGVFEMTDALRAQFAADSHISLFYTGLTPSTPFTAQVTVRDVLDYDASSTLTISNVTTTAADNPAIVPDAFISSLLGQTVSYQVNNVTAAAGQTPQYLLSIFSTAPIDTTGLTVFTGALNIPGVLANTANAFVNGYFATTLVVTPTAGKVDVPASVLAQGVGDGVSSLLMISGLQAGTAVNVDMTVRNASQILEPGVYSQTFDASGAAEGPAQRIDDADASLAVAAPIDPDDDEEALAIVATEDGGFRVSWVSGAADDDASPPRLISREFDASGAAVGTAIDVSAADIPGVVAVSTAGGDVSVPDQLHLVELGNGGFATLLQVDAEEVYASTRSFAVAPGGVNTGSVTFAALQGQLDSVQIDTGNAVGAALASQTRAGFVGGKGLDGNALQVPVTVENGRFVMTEAIRAQFAPGEELFLTVTGVTNPASSNSFSFVFIPAFIGSRDIYTYDAGGPTLTINNVVNAFTNPTAPASSDASFGSSIGQTIAYQINGLTASATETPDYVLYVTSAQPINTAGLSVYTGTNAAPLYSTTPNNTLSPLGVFATTISVTPVAGRIDVPQALLDQFPHGGMNIALNIRGLQGGTQVNVDTIVQQPSDILDTGLFVQLFDSAGEPTGDFIRVDDTATAVIDGDDYSQSSIQSDGAGGFRVIWKSDADGDDDGDALHIRHFDATGQQIGDTTSINSIPDRIYDEGEAVTLYTAGLFADPDPNDFLTFSAAGLPEGLDIDPATGIISGNADLPGLFAVIVTATDSGGLSASTDFEIFIVDDGIVIENLAPTGISFTNTVSDTPENGASLKVADIVVDDDGLGTNILALSGDDAAQFSIVDGALYYNGSGDFETQAALNVTVSVSDPALEDAPVSQDFELLLTDVFEPDNLAPTAVSFNIILNTPPENSGLVKVADILVADDGNGTNDLALSGANADAFTIIGTELYFNGGNFEARAVYFVTVSASDPSLPDAPVSQDFTVLITDVAEVQPYVGTNGDDTFYADPFSLDSWVADGGRGNDLLVASAYSDTVLGSSGDDTIFGGGSADTLNGGGGLDYVSGDDGDDNILGDGGNDTLVGGAGADTIDGGADNDTIAGDDGDDNLLGGMGDDQIDGGLDNDTIDGGTGNDILLGGVGADNVLGGIGNDTINGNGGSDNLAGGSGNDTIRGDGGADEIFGDVGDDNLGGGSGLDLVDGGAGNDFVSGDLGNDTLLGGIGNDTINGGGNNDLINGGAGTDLMTGGSGADTFVFALKSDSRLGLLADHITDFNALEDRLDLSGLDASTKLLNDQAFVWIGSGTFTKSAGQLRYEVISGNAHITGDLNGDAKADFEIVLDGVISLPGSSDFLIL